MFFMFIGSDLLYHMRSLLAIIIKKQNDGNDSRKITKTTQGLFRPSLRFDPSYDMIKAEKMILQITIELKTE